MERLSTISFAPDRTHHTSDHKANASAHPRTEVDAQPPESLFMNTGMPTISNPIGGR